MKARVVDIETSGLPEEGGRICEIAWYDVDLVPPYPILGGRSYLVNPCMTIPPEIRAVHHIDPIELIGRPVPGWAVAEICDGLEPGDVMVAHNAQFEAAFIPAPAGIPWCCTYKVSLRAWPANKSHGNQALRYALGIDSKPDFNPGLAMPPHRAAPDAYVTAFLFREELTLGRPLERLLEISAEPALLSVCTMPKHRGTPYKEIAAKDPGYLTWIIDKSDLDADTKFSAKYWLERSKEKAGD